MEPKHPGDTASPKVAASMGIIMLLLGLMIIFTLQPPSAFEPGSGMGNYWMPGSSHGGQGTTPPTTTSPSPYTTLPAVSTATPTPVLDVLAPINDTATI
jgi:hypothetical protein